ncbi:hypothetical protein PIB30_072744 [Stylosanthes scabra]|uniref:Uncharacterized protein n=1 Tax=Stylosanthes scabra TaxID=79078 RepID=A0ABU6ZMU6_9FABA|nr:hypothetical protein [Stylosanthes scabra]
MKPTSSIALPWPLTLFDLPSPIPLSLSSTAAVALSPAGTVLPLPSPLPPLVRVCGWYNLNNCNLVGKIITDKDFSFSAIRAGLMGMSGNANAVAIIEVGRNTMLLSFNDHEKGQYILNGVPRVLEDTF